MINDLDEVQYSYLLAPTFQFVNSAGKPITGGWMEVYIHGTRTKYYCCSDWDGTLHPFKIPLDSLGSNIVLASPAFAYDVYVYNRFGSLIMSRYNVIPSTGGASGVIPVDITIESQDETVDVTVSGTTYNLSISGTIDKLDTVSADVEELKDIIASGLVQSDWEESDSDNPAYIKNKPDLSIYATTDDLETASGNLVDLIEEVSANIPEQVQSDWAESDTSSPAYIKNKPEESTLIAGDNIGIFASGSDYVISASGVDTSEFATHSEVNNVSGSIITVVNNVSSILENEIQAVSAAIPDVSEFVTETELTSAIDVITGTIPQAQVQSDWTEDDTTDPAYIKNKPDEVNLVAGDNISIVASGTDLIISASGSSPQPTVPNVEIVSPSDSIVVSATVDPQTNTKTFSIDVATASGVEYGQFYATGVTGTANMAKTKGNISVNNGRIQLHKGQSYHVTIRGTYTQTTLTNELSFFNFIENISFRNIAINVNKTISAGQYWELSYDLYNLSADTDYIVAFNNISNAVLSDIIVEVHSLAGGNGTGGSASGVEYTAGYGIQILNDVISVSGINPQVNADWNAVSGVSQVLNKPTEVELVAGSGINITESNNQYIISSTVTGGGTAYQEGYGIDIANDTISVDASLIPNVSAVQAMISAASGSNNLFIATYGSTSRQDLIDAYNAGKYIVCKVDISSANNDYEFAPLYKYKESNQGFYFVRVPCETTSSNKLRGSYGITIYWNASNVSYANKWNAYSYSLISNWNETDTQSINYIQNKPDLSVYTTSSQVSAIASAYASGGGGSGVNYQAGDHIAITGTTISVTGIGNVIAGSNISIAASGENIVISSSGGAQVQANWDESDSSSPAYIQNKPSIPQSPEQSDWNETDSSSLAYIKNKPNISEAYTGASGIAIDNSVISLDEPLGIVAGSGINIVIEGDSAIICVSGVTGGGSSYNEGYGIDINNDTISVDTTVIPDVSAVQQMIAAASGSNNLFIATYNVTSWSDINNAITSGKYVICLIYEFNQPRYWAVLGEGWNGDFIRFYRLERPSGVNPAKYIVYVCRRLSSGYNWYTETYNLQADWNETVINSTSFIKNKPDLSVYTTSTQVSAIVEAATGSIPTPVQVNSDWNATSGVAEILNKPVEANLLAGSGITIAASGSDYVINTTPIELVTALPANPVSGVLYLIPEA